MILAGYKYNPRSDVGEHKYSPHPPLRLGSHKVSVCKLSVLTLNTMKSARAQCIEVPKQKQHKTSK